MIDSSYILLALVCVGLVVFFLCPSLVKREIAKKDSALLARRTISIPVPGKGSKPPVFLSVPATDKAIYDWMSFPLWLRNLISDIAGYLPDQLHKFVSVGVIYPDEFGGYHVSIVSSRQVKTGRAMDYAWTLSTFSPEVDSDYYLRLEYWRDGSKCTVHGGRNWVRSEFIRSFLELLREDAEVARVEGRIAE